MALTSDRRIPSAREFVRLGFGDAIDPTAPFYSHEFLTQVLTTPEVQAAIPVVSRFNAFDGEKVAEAIGRFRGRVSGWKFGAAGSPLLIVVLAPWTHQIEDVPPSAPSGRKFLPDETNALVAELRTLFLDSLGADKFELNGGSKFEYGAWWD